MKKVYEKPRAAVEYFSLTQNIAESCGYNDEEYYGKPNQADKGACGWETGFGPIYWTSPGSKCSGNYPENMPGAEVCYNSPAGLPMIFAS